MAYTFAGHEDFCDAPAAGKDAARFRGVGPLTGLLEVEFVNKN
jgi:hypothetical protein